MEKKRAHVFISGKVQGVYFRDSTEAEALKKSVTGWVRNLRDGRVEAVFEGDAPSVDSVLDWCHTGPPGALVMRVEVHQEPFIGEYSTFEVQRTYS